MQARLPLAFAMLFGCHAPRALTGDERLEDGFTDRISMGYACFSQMGDGSAFYTLLPSDETFRLQAELPVDPNPVDHADLPESVSTSALSVFSGKSLITDQGTNKCDDVVMNSWQRIDYKWTAISGTSERIDNVDGTVGLRLIDVVLTPDPGSLSDPQSSGNHWDDLEDIVIDDVILPPLPTTGELTSVEP